MKKNANIIWSILGIIEFFSIALIHSYYPASTQTFWVVSALLVLIILVLGNLLSRER